MCNNFGHKYLEYPATFSYMVKRSPNNEWKPEERPTTIIKCSRCQSVKYSYEDIGFEEKNTMFFSYDTYYTELAGDLYTGKYEMEIVKEIYKELE